MWYDVSHLWYNVIRCITPVIQCDTMYHTCDTMWYDVSHQWYNVIRCITVSASGWRSGGPRFKSRPRLISQSWSSYQLNQLGSKAASDSTLKQLTLAGYQILVLYFLSAKFSQKYWTNDWMNGLIIQTCDRKNKPAFERIFNGWSDIQSAMYCPKIYCTRKRAMPYPVCGFRHSLRSDTPFASVFQTH